MPNTVREMKSVNNFGYFTPMGRRLVVSGVPVKVKDIIKKRVNAVITFDDPAWSPVTVKLEDELTWEYDVPTEEEKAAVKLEHQVSYIDRWVERQLSLFKSEQLAIAQVENPIDMPSYRLDNLLKYTAWGSVAQHVKHAIDQKDTDEEKVDVVRKMLANVLRGVWGSRSTSMASNELDHLKIEAWADLSRDLTESL